MAIETIPETIKNHFYNSKGWRTKRKIVVIESDDWGGIRMTSNKDFQALQNKINISSNHYNKYDSLETQEDLEELYDCLQSFKDIKGNCPIITANFVSTNPDFDKIKSSNFENYYYETFPTSYKKYHQNENTFPLIKEGIKNKLILPQFHGREHLQVEYWMRDLRNNKKETILGFNHNFFGFGKNEMDNQGYLSSFNVTSINDIKAVEKRIEEGLSLFESIFKFNSLSVIAPQNIMHYKLLPVLKKSGIEIIQGARVNKQFPLYKGDKAKQKRFLGEVNSHDQLQIVRNVVFEPSSKALDWISKCIKEIETAFFWGKPAVICSHRVNYMGGLDSKNRKKGVDTLKRLLENIQKKWPDVEFMSTVTLAKTILSEKEYSNKY